MCFETECEICAAQGGAQELLGELKKRGRVLRSRLRSQRTSSSSSRIVRRRPRRRTIVVGTNPTFFWPPWMNLTPTPAPNNANVAPMPGGSAADLPPEEPAAAEPEPANDPEPAGDGAADGGSASSTVEEEVTRRGMNLTITWAPVSLPNNLEEIPAKPGIYVVLVGGVPTYVGMSKSLQGRWKGRLQGIKSALKPITLWCGVLNDTGGVSRDEALRGAEQAAIRLLMRYSPSSKVKLDNARSTKFFRVKAGGREFIIHNPLPEDLLKRVVLDASNRTARFNEDKSVLTIDAGGTSPEYLSPWRARRP